MATYFSGEVRVWVEVVVPVIVFTVTESHCGINGEVVTVSKGRSLRDEVNGGSSLG